MLKIAVMVSGGGTNLQAILDAIKDKKITNAEVVQVISSSEKAYALKRAENAGISSVRVTKRRFPDPDAFEEALLSALKKCRADLIVLAGYLVVLPKSVIDAYPNRIINIHPSLIPSFCGDGFYGLKVHEMALKRGVKLTGATVHFVDAGTDTGPIILQKAVEVKEGDTPKILQKRVMEEAEWRILPQAINLIANDQIEVVDGKVLIRK